MKHLITSTVDVLTVGLLVDYAATRSLFGDLLVGETLKYCWDVQVEGNYTV